MHANLRRYLAAGAAVAVAGVIAVTPVESPPPDGVRSEGPAVHLTASVANIPVNLFQAVANIPANAVAGWQATADAFEEIGSWWVYSPTNVLGFHRTDTVLLTALIDAVLPFPAWSKPVGEAFNLWAQANLPVHAGCTGISAPCDDLSALLGVMFQVSVFELMRGYTFPEETDEAPYNPVRYADGSIDETPWADGEPRYLRPLAPVTSVIDYLMAEPEGIQPVSVRDVLETVWNLVASLNTAFNPFTENSYLLKPSQNRLAAQLLAPIAPILCNCTPNTEPPTAGESPVYPGEPEGAPFPPFPWRDRTAGTDADAGPDADENESRMSTRTSEESVSPLRARIGDLPEPAETLDTETLDTETLEAEKSDDAPQPVRATTSKTLTLDADLVEASGEEVGGEEVGIEDSSTPAKTRPIGSTPRDRLADRPNSDRATSDRGGTSGASSSGPGLRRAG